MSTESTLTYILLRVQSILTYIPMRVQSTLTYILLRAEGRKQTDLYTVRVESTPTGILE